MITRTIINPLHAGQCQQLPQNLTISRVIATADPAITAAAFDLGHIASAREPTAIVLNYYSFPEMRSR